MMLPIITNMFGKSWGPLFEGHECLKCSAVFRR
jgi:hypothetical protein